MPATILGLHFEGSDPSAALLKDGQIVAFAEEERFLRTKHASGKFPTLAARFCLEQGGIALDDVDAIAVGWDADKFPEQIGAFYAKLRDEHELSTKAIGWQEKNRTRYTRDALLKQIAEGLGTPYHPEVHFIEHHRAHAASTFLLSGFEQAAVLTADGHGEDDCASFWLGKPGGEIEHLQRWLLPHSLGWFYTKFTQWFGWRAHDGEGKLMGLAAYGKRDPDLVERVAKVIDLTGDERVYAVSPRFFFGEFVDSGPYTPELIELFGEPRPFESKEPFTQRDKDLAWAVQDALERIGVALADALLKRTGQTRLCVAGGTFMNCKLNGVLARRVGFENYFAIPAAGDNGISLGAALALHQRLGHAWSQRLTHMYYGPEFDTATSSAALEAAGLEWIRPSNLELAVATLLADSKVVGWFQGRMEGGARALGARSILANPLDPEISGIVNGKVKFREPWRPFCPTTTVESGRRYFDYEGELPFMIVACDAREGVEEQLPSVVHVDHTVRVQAVRAETNPRLHALLQAFGGLTGHEVLLNTSFNVKGEPIVCSPADAVACFLKTGMDALVLGDLVVTEKPPATTPPAG